jgi:hypothetical protein
VARDSDLLKGIARVRLDPVALEALKSARFVDPDVVKQITSAISSHASAMVLQPEFRKTIRGATSFQLLTPDLEGAIRKAWMPSLVQGGVADTATTSRS